MLLWWLLTVAALAYAIRAWNRVRELEGREKEHRIAFAQLAGRVTLLEGGTRPAAADGQASATPPAPEPVVDVPRAAPAPEPTPAPEPGPAPPPPVIPPPPIVPPPPRMVEPPRVDELAPVRPPIAAPPPPPPPRMIDWEGLVGVKLFSWIAGVALVFAAVFFLRYSIDRGWLTAPIRMTIGLVVGVGLLVGCELRAARRYPVTANALDAAGTATLFATLFAAHALWDLVPQLPTFAAMAVVAAVAVTLSVRHDSPFIALLGLLGGFATPALLSTGENRPIGLFGYLLLLNVGLAWVAYQRGWAFLTAGSVVLTTLYQWAWVFRYLDESPLPLAMGIFLVFPIFHVAAMLVAGRERSDESPLFSRMAIGAAVVPLLFGIYLSVIPSYGVHAGLLFGFVLVTAAGLALVAAVRGPTEVHLVGALGTVLAFLVWCATSYQSAHWPGILGWVTLGVGLYLAAPAVAAGFGRSLDEAGGHGRAAAASLLAVIVFLVWSEPAAANPMLPFGLLLVLLAIIAAVSIATGDGAPHFVGATLALVAQAAWSAQHLEPERLYTAMTWYAVFGVFFATVPVVAQRLGRRLSHERCTAITIVASITLVLFLAVGPVAHMALGGIALLLGGFVALLFLPFVAGPFPLLLFAGIAIAWIVLVAWWTVAMTATLLLPALAVVGGMGLLVAAGHGFLGARRGERDPVLAFGAGFAVVAHGFLALVVVQPDLSTPPWPWLGVLAVVDLAIALGALALRDGVAHGAAVVASQAVILLWSAHAVAAPWPLVALLAADGVVALAFGWIALARRRGIPLDVFGGTAVASALLAVLIAIRVAESPGPPAAGVIAVEHGVLTALLLAIAQVTGWHRVRWMAAGAGAVAAALWVGSHVGPDTWRSGVLVAAVPFVVLLADAFRVGPRAAGAMASYQAATASGVVFLALARHCVLIGGLEHVIGIVPVAQALAFLLLVRRVVASESADRDPQLALVAAAALGFATAAIPLQLSLEHLTVALALEATALAWLYRRIRFPQLLLWIAGLGVAVFVRLTLNPEVLAYHPRTGTPIFNWYLYVYGVSAAAFVAAAALLRDTDDRLEVVDRRLSQLLPAAATVLLFLLLNLEIADFYSTGRTLTFNFTSASLAQDLTYTLAWATFAIVLLAAGIRVGSRGVRGAALGLLVVTILKCFVRDLWRLGGLYRVGSFVGLAICLSIVAVLLQRFVFVPKEEESRA